MQQCAIDSLDSLPGGSEVSVPVEQLKQLLQNYMDLLDTVQDLRNLLDEKIENLWVDWVTDVALGQQKAYMGYFAAQLGCTTSWAAA